MANVLIESQTMTDIANAIREKSGTVEKMKPAEMPKTIREMEVVDTGVGSRQWWLDVFSQKKNFANMFEGCSMTTIPQLDTSNGTNFVSMFYLFGNLTTIPQLDTSNGTNFYNMFYHCYALKNISFVAGCIKKSISFAQSDKLTDESIQSIIDGLADLTGQTAQTITFHPDVKNKLTEEQIASVTSKNWNIA